MFLLDTNVLSELRRRDRTDANVACWADSVDAGALYLSAIVVLEIELGARLIARRDAAQGTVLRRWIDTKVLPAFSGRILPIDTAVAQRCAALHVPAPRAERDALIASTALVHCLEVVTRNTNDFKAMGVGLVNPWERLVGG